MSFNYTSKYSAERVLARCVSESAIGSANQQGAIGRVTLQLWRLQHSFAQLALSRLNELKKHMCSTLSDLRLSILTAPL